MSDLLPITNARSVSIDSVRGLVIVLMALDRVREFFSSFRGDPLDPATTTVSLYLTRWMTHLCAPTFVLLAGIGAYLMSKHSAAPNLRSFLITRGLWIVFLEVTLVLFGWRLAVGYHYRPLLQVMWAIGVSMVVLGTVAHLSPIVVGVIGASMIVTHNLLDGIAPATFGVTEPLQR